MAPIEAAHFELQMQALAEQKKTEKAKGNVVSVGKGGPTFACEPCHKTFVSQLLFERHAATNKHKKKCEKKPSPSKAPGSAGAAKDNEDDEEENTAEAEAEEDDLMGDQEFKGTPIPLKSCMFCPKTFETLEASLTHMLQDHGFFIPFAEYLTDVESLLIYLGFKVGVGKVCMYCNGRNKASYSSLRAVQQHMNEKNHCKIRFEEEEGEDEFLEFYDFEKDLNAGEDGQEEDMVGGILLLASCFFLRSVVFVAA